MGISTNTATAGVFARLSAHLLNATNEVIFALDPAGNVTYANAAAERMYGWDAGARPTYRMADNGVCGASVDPARELMTTVRDGHVWTGRLEIRRRDGRWFPVEATATPVLDDGILTDIIVVASDLSQREDAEERLAESESWLREAQRLTHVGHWRWHVASDRAEWLAEEMYAIHGVTSEWAGTLDAYMALVPRDDHPTVRAATDEVLRTGTADVVHRIVRPDGATRHVRNRCEATYAADGTPVLVFGTCQDVTDQVVLKTALKERVKELTCLVAVGQVLHDMDDPAGVYVSVVASLARAMRRPDRALAVIDIDGQQHSSASAPELHVASHLAAAPVLVGGQERGRIHLGYPDGGDDVLPEERYLLDAVAAMVSLWLERRQSAAAVVETESRFRRLVHNVPDVVFRFRLGDDGGFDYVSPAVEPLTGHTAEEFLANPQLVERLLGPPERAGASASAGGDANIVTSDLVHIAGRVGSPRWVEYNLVQITDDHGRGCAVEGVARDVTDRVIAAQASQDRAHEQAVLARISEAAVTASGLDALFAIAARLVVETLPVQASSITELDASGRNLLVRGGFGWADGVVGVATFPVADSFAEQTLDSDSPSVLADLHAEGPTKAPFLSANGLVSGVAVRIAGNRGTFGAVGAFSNTARAYSSEHMTFLQTVAHILGAAVDRWQAEAALASRERHFRTLAESLPDIVRRIDRDHRHVYVNRAVATLGMSAEDVIGRTLREVGLPADRAAVLEHAADEVFASGHKMSVDFDVHTQEGARYLQSVMVPEFSDEGAVATVLCVTRDLTAARRAEELRREGLTRIVAAQEAERGRIAEDIHDDSIQVMTAVGMRVEGLRRQTDDPQTELMLGHLEEVVRHSINRLRALMFALRPPELDREGLLAALRLYVEATSGEGAPQCEIIDEWKMALPVEARTVLYRIALEAITNARKHAGAAHVEVLFDAAEGGVRMRVRDDGSGFDPAMLADVGPHHVGTRTMRERAEAAGGTCEIHSAPGGTVLTVRLPATTEIGTGGA